MDAFSSKIIRRDTKKEDIPLIIPFKTIRDAVHGDIHLCKFEIDLINTIAFQRLRHIRQLGFSYLVYPSLQHTRFEHSIGTLHMAQKIVNSINSNPDRETSISDPRDLLLIRSCALLHDLCNIPFGHTLEDEGALFESQWKNNDRKEYFLGENSEIGKLLSEVDSKYRDEVENILTVKNDEIHLLEKPFIADIVGNTICADLLDYLKRDAYFSGIKAVYDERLLKYLFIPDSGTHINRLVLRLWYKDAMRVDTVSDILNLLRLRYSLGEKIYYHHTKMYISSMIITAISSENIHNEDNLINALNIFGDDELLTYLGELDIQIDKTKEDYEEYIIMLGNKEEDVCRYIINNIRNRRIYKPIYELQYAAERYDDINRKIKNELISCCRKDGGKIKYNLERYIEHLSHIPYGSISIYAPEEKMGIKIANVIVQWGDQRVILNNLNETFESDIQANYVYEQASNINMNWRNLWKFLVLIDRSVAFDENGNRTDTFYNVKRVWDWILAEIQNGLSVESIIGNAPSDEITKIKYQQVALQESDIDDIFVYQQNIIDSIHDASSYVEKGRKRFMFPDVAVLKEIINNDRRDEKNEEKK